jgi:hypothetical protein
MFEAHEIPVIVGDVDLPLTNTAAVPPLTLHGFEVVGTGALVQAAVVLLGLLPQGLEFLVHH